MIQLIVCPVEQICIYDIVLQILKFAYWNKENNSKNLIGHRVKELRTDKQLSQKALAEQLQLAGYEFSDLTVLRIEQGTRFVPDYEVVALAEFFHVSCEYLLGVIEEK